MPRKRSWRPRRKVAVGGLAGAVAIIIGYFGFDTNLSQAIAFVIVTVGTAYLVPGEVLAQHEDSLPPPADPANP